MAITNVAFNTTHFNIRSQYKHAPSGCSPHHSRFFIISFPQSTMKTIRATITGAIFIEQRYLRVALSRNMFNQLLTPTLWRFGTTLVDVVINVIIIEMVKLSLSGFASPNITSYEHLNNIVLVQAGAQCGQPKWRRGKNGKFSEIALNRAQPYI